MLTPILLLCGVYYSVSYESTYDEMVGFNEVALNHMTAVSDNVINETAKSLAYLSQNTSVKTYISFYQTLHSEQLTQDVRDIMDSIRVGSRYISSVVVYSDKNEMFISNFLGGTTGNAVADELSELYDTLTVSDDNIHIFFHEYLGNYPYYITLAMDVNADNDDTIDGMIFINIDVLELGAVMHDESNSAELYLLLDNTIAYSSSRAFIGESVSSLEFYNSEEQRNSTSNPISINDSARVISVQKSSRDGISYMTVTDFSAYSDLLERFTLLVVGILTLAVIATILCAYLLSLKAYRPLKNIFGFLESPKEGSGSVTISAEVKEISNSFMEMIHTNSELKEELEKRIKTLYDAKLVALQAQINPHFLYNTLDTVAYMADDIIGEDNDIAEMLIALSKLYRVALEAGNETVTTLKEELQHTHLYEKILKIRYKDRFDVVYDISNELLDCEVVKLFLQPLIENAVGHGIRTAGGRGIIKISARREGDKLIFVIEDNGGGISPNRLQELQGKLAQSWVLSKKSIGIANIHLRIGLVYGDEYGIQIDSKEGEYTKVTVLFPYKKLEDTV